MSPKPSEKRQVVRFAFYTLDSAWRRLSAERQASSKLEFGQIIESFAGRLLLRPYGLVGIRGDCDFLLWQVAENLDALVALQTALNRTDLGAYLTSPYSYLAMTRRSIYEFPEDPGQPSRLVIRPSEARYLFVYPFIKTRAWYMLPKADRQTMMDEHVRTGRKYPSIRLNTTYSYGLDDQEFIVAFEGDEPADFLDLVMELRESQASSYTLRDTPTFTCVQMSLWDMLDTLGGAGSAQATARRPTRADGYTPVATLADLPAGASRRVYVGGDAVALFNVQGTVYAIANRCTHARASLSEGTVDPAGCTVTCPWHEGVFSLETGQVLGGPPSLPVLAYRVKLEGDTVFIAPPSSHPAPAEAREPTVAPHS
ncbi:MAG TPA: chlorite dismutase family protein [Gemmatimonadales bacterium]|nr:chlorite dismutase family protein [Gemmatimonadales bacterium]